MALAREAYAVDERLRDRDPDGARRLRKAAVAVPAHLAGALSAGETLARQADASAARAALAELASRAERLPVHGGSAGDLLQHARELERSVGLLLGTPRSFVC